MDMVGWDSDEQAYFEIHAGHGTNSVRDASVLLAEKIRAWGDAMAGLDGAQVYSGQIGTEGADRTLYDPAIGRSCIHSTTLENQSAKGSAYNV